MVFRLGIFSAMVMTLTIARADDKPAAKWEPPAPPEGWQVVVSSDNAYRYFVPKDVKGSSSRDQTITRNRIRMAIKSSHYVLKDGTEFEFGAVALSGSGIEGTKVSDLLDNWIDSDKEAGFEVSEPKSLKVGPIKARDYYLAKDKIVRRLVLFGVPPRIFCLDITTQDKTKLDDETAKTFLTSVVMTPKEVLEADAKERAAKAAELDKEMLKKYGTCWTLDPKVAKIPEADAIGMVGGKEFKPTVTLAANLLSFHTGKPPFYDQEIVITLPLKKGETFEEKKYLFGPADIKPGSSPSIALSWMPENARVPKRLTYSQKYNLQLTFDKKTGSGELPGTIYVSLPETGRSFFAGKFVAKDK